MRPLDPAAVLQEHRAKMNKFHCVVCLQLQNPDCGNPLSQMAPVHQQINNKEKKGVKGETHRLRET